MIALQINEKIVVRKKTYSIVPRLDKKKKTDNECDDDQGHNDLAINSAQHYCNLKS